MKNMRRYFLCALIAPLLFVIFVLGPKVFADGGLKNATSGTLNVERIPVQKWTGNEITPTVTIKDGDTTVENDNFTFVYNNNTNTSTSGSPATVTITASGSGYTGSTTAKFYIVEKTDLKDATIELYADESKTEEVNYFVYTGSEIKPYEKVTLNDIVLTKGVDYTVEYENNEEVSVEDSVARVIITAIDKSGYTGTNKVNGNSKGKFAIIGKNIQINTPIEFNNLTYNGNDQQLIKSGYSASGAVSYHYGIAEENKKSAKKTVSDITSDSLKGKNAGTYIIYTLFAADTNYRTLYAWDEVTIAKKNPELTAPVVNTGLIYSNSGQELIQTAAGGDSADTADELKIEYAVTSTSGSAPASGWTSSTSGITATNAGKYYIWYRTQETDNFNAFTSTSGIEVEIAKYQPTFDESYSGTSKDYTGSEIDMDAADEYIKFVGDDSYDKNTHGTITYTYEKSVSGSYVSMSGQKPVEVNNEEPYKVTVSLSGSTNYKSVSKDVTLKVLRVSPSVSGLDYVTSSLTYNGSNQALVNSFTPVSEVSLQYSLSTSNSAAGTSWSGVAPQAKNAGTYYIWYKSDQTANYKAINETCLGSSSGKTIDKFTPTISVSGKTVTYDGTETNFTESDVTVELVASETYSGTNWPLTFGYYSNSGCADEVTSHSGAGTYYVKASLSGKGNYNAASGSGTLTVDKDDPSFTNSPSGKTLTYNGQAQELIDAGSTNDGTIEYYKGDTASTSGNDWSESTSGIKETKAGTYTFWYKISGDNNHNDLDAASGTATINKLSVEDAKVSVSGVQDATYTGSEITQPNITVSYSGIGTVSPDDYKVSYSDNTNAGTASYLITFKNNYSGSKSGTFEIEKADSSFTSSPSGKTNLTYNTEDQDLFEDFGSASGGSIYYYVGDETPQGEPSASGWVDQSASGLKRKNAGTYTIWYKLFGDSNHNNIEAASGTVTINKAENGFVAPTAINSTYNKEYQTLVNAGSKSGGTIYYLISTSGSGSASGTYADNLSSISGIDAKDYYVWYKLDGESNYKDVDETYVKVTISPEKVTAANSSVSGVVDKSYSGGAALTQDNITVSHSGLGEIPKSDYTVSYSGNTNAGIARYSIAFKNNFSGSLSGTFKINGDDPTVTNPTANDLTYNGAYQQLVAAGSASGGTLEYLLSSTSGSSSGTYTTDVSSISGKDVGTYYVWYQTIGDEPNYNDIDPQLITVTIAPRAYNETDFTISSVSGQTYTGEEYKPEPTITYNNGVSGSGSYSGTLKKGSDYTLTYKNNKDASTSGKVTISFSGSYSGTTYKTFNIYRKDVSSISGTLDNYTYYELGEEIKPEPTLTYGSLTLAKDTDYTLSYSGNIKYSESTSGKVTVTVTGIGNYTGTKDIDFTLNKNTVTASQSGNGDLIITCSNSGYINALTNVTDVENDKPKVTLSFSGTIATSTAVNSSSLSGRIVKVDDNTAKVPYSVFKEINEALDKYEDKTSSTLKQISVTITIKDFTSESIKVDTTHGIEYIDLTVQNDLAAEDQTSTTTFYLDGIELSAAEAKAVPITENKTSIVQTYTFADTSGGTDIHKKYPTSFNVYKLTKAYDEKTGVSSATFKHLSELDDIMVYAGTSIRVTTNKSNGIRIITSVPSSKRNKMIGTNPTGIEGYKIVEYGTVVGWDASSSESGRIDPTVVLKNGKYEANSNCIGNGYAYGDDGSYNKVFATKKDANNNEIIQFTNVIIESSVQGKTWDYKLKNDFALRSYMVIRPIGATGTSQDVVIYGGTLHRSIYYIADANKNAFTKNSDPYNYIQSIITKANEQQPDA